MDPNNLVVSVLSARGLTLKGHNKLDAFITLSLSGPGSWKSKVQTDVRRTTGECQWDQRCEFVVYGMDSVMTVTASHKTVLGTGECIGVLEFPLKVQYERQAPMWFRLRKKGKTGEDPAQNKYRGELLLRFEFDHKNSTSMTSLNTIHNDSKSRNTIIPIYNHSIKMPWRYGILDERGKAIVRKGRTLGTSALDVIKRKMKMGKKNGRDSESASVAAFPIPSGRRSPGGDGISFAGSHTSLNMTDADQNGLIIPPVKIRQSAHRSTLSMTPIETLPEEQMTGLMPSADSSVLMRHSRTPSPVSLTDTEDIPSPQGRPQSTTSSGFGSAKSSLGVNDTFNKLRQSALIDRPVSCVANLMAKGRSSKDPKKPSYDDLERQVEELHLELLRREGKERDLKEYIGNLLSRIMEVNPNLLESLSMPQHH